MKFENVKVGDTVLKPVLIKTGTNYHGKTFYVNGTVDRVTKTQISVDGVRVNRKTGVEIGARSDIWSPTPIYYPVGYIHGHNARPMQDQTHEMNLLKRRLRLLRYCERFVKSFGNLTMELSESEFNELEKPFLDFMAVQSKMADFRKSPIKSDDTEHGGTDEE